MTERTITVSGYLAELDHLARVADQLGAERIATEARALAERVAEGRFYLACIGQFKRGKSTLLDALIREPLLPTGIVPVTSVATVVRFGTERSARVRVGKTWQTISIESLPEYVAEEHNPENVKGVEGVEVFVPAALLSGGMCLVDTPGIGSIFMGNTASTQAFIPHIDAALVVIGTDPPISGDELELIRAVSRNVKHFFFVLNKADRASADERKAAVQFALGALRGKLGIAVDRVYQVSALDQLQAGTSNRDWPALESALRELNKSSGRTLARWAFDRGVQRLTRHTLSALREERDALIKPIEDSEQRIIHLRKTVADAESSLSDLGVLLTAEQQRLAATFARRRSEFLKDARETAAATFRAQITIVPTQYGPIYRRVIMDAADSIARDCVLPWLRSEQASAHLAYQRAMLRFVSHARDFLNRLPAGFEFASVGEDIDYQDALEERSHFYFESFIPIRRPASPPRYLADAILSAIHYLSPIQRDGYAFLDRLLETNSSRVQHDVESRVAESRTKLERRIRDVLNETVVFCQRALDCARATRDRGQQAIEHRLRLLESVEASLCGPPLADRDTSSRPIT